MAPVLAAEQWGASCGQAGLCLWNIGERSHLRHSCKWGEQKQFKSPHTEVLIFPELLTDLECILWLRSGVCNATSSNVPVLGLLDASMLPSHLDQLKGQVFPRLSEIPKTIAFWWGFVGAEMHPKVAQQCHLRTDVTEPCKRTSWEKKHGHQF